MGNPCKTISVITPFYKGNRYINELVSNVNTVAEVLHKTTGTEVELIIVNDSPDIPVEITVQSQISVTVLENPKNLGIHGSRIHGIQYAKGEWIQMLDQDDLLIPEKYAESVKLCHSADVVVGNCYYYRGAEKDLLYANKSVMDYLITEDRFLTIRNLIASPGHCLIRKASLPAYWLENPMYVNGADDYYLWVLQFHQGVRFAKNAQPVYVHRNSEEGNLSFDLEKMYRSCMEMCDLLAQCPDYPARKLCVLKQSVTFKYHYDVKKLKPFDIFRYWRIFWCNGIYKIGTWIRSLVK